MMGPSSWLAVILAEFMLYDGSFAARWVLCHPRSWLECRENQVDLSVSLMRSQLWILTCMSDFQELLSS